MEKLFAMVSFGFLLSSLAILYRAYKLRLEAHDLNVECKIHLSEARDSLYSSKKLVESAEALCKGKK